ncbi:MAG TPA: BrxA/BrxB family bacilliredoxin [Bacteroidia bacterium]|nr:BrxA/BrxB family bacilliredoxin [Bacteroidia bacterium]HNT79240.1 BrxA/BrxB family bacilliredoxin [Bacteroidia bacterium]
MPYPEELCTPMREELTVAGFEELKSANDVENAIPASKGTVLLLFNSVCGCAAGSARPGVKMAIQNDKKPTKLFTVFAGQDVEATNKAREFTMPYPPSSPSVALFKDGNLVHFIERHHIEGRSAQMISENLVEAFNEFC